VWPALIEAREEQEVVDEHTHARRRLFDPAHRLRKIVGPGVRAAPEQLRIATDRGERCAQLVRRVRDEPSEARFGRGALGERGFDLAEHGVEREAEPANFRFLVGGLDAA